MCTIPAVLLSGLWWDLDCFTVGLKLDCWEGGLQLSILQWHNRAQSFWKRNWYHFISVPLVNIPLSCCVWVLPGDLEHCISAAAPAAPWLMVDSTFTGSHLAWFCCSWWMSVVSVVTLGCLMKSPIFIIIFSPSSMGPSATTAGKTNLQYYDSICQEWPLSHTVG